jgi:hypothetical protein
MSYQGPIHRPYDTAHGELDYDSFAWDVGCLGIVLCQEFQVRLALYVLAGDLTSARSAQHLTRTLPFLAPLFDKMVAHDVHRRFTAQEALQFFESCVTTVPSEAMAVFPNRAPRPRPTYEAYDRWAAVPPQLVREWGHLREVPVSGVQSFLRHTCKTRSWAGPTLRFVRRVLRLVVLGHRKIWTHLRSLLRSIHQQNGIPHGAGRSYL